MIPLRDSQGSGRFPIFTLIIIAATVYGFYLELMALDIEAFFARFALIPATVDSTQPITWIPFLSSMFLHGGLLHIASNMWFLWIFGDNVEERFGLLYLPIYLIGGLVGGLAQYAMDPTSSIPIVGASGAVATVLGAYFIFFPRHTVTTLVPIFFFLTVVHLPAFAVLAFWFITQLFSGTAALTETVANSGGGIAYFAHIGGFLTGVAAAYLFGGPAKNSFHRLRYE